MYSQNNQFLNNQMNMNFSNMNQTQSNFQQNMLSNMQMNKQNMGAMYQDQQLSNYYQQGQKINYPNMQMMQNQMPNQIGQQMQQQPMMKTLNANSSVFMPNLNQPQQNFQNQNSQFMQQFQNNTPSIPPSNAFNFSQNFQQSFTPQPQFGKQYNNQQQFGNQNQQMTQSMSAQFPKLPSPTPQQMFAPVPQRSQQQQQLQQNILQNNLKITTPNSVISQTNNIESNNNNDNNESNDKELDKIVQYIIALRNFDKREEALNELSKKKETYQNLAPILWHSVGTIAILFLLYFFFIFVYRFFKRLQEIVSIYGNLSPPQLHPSVSTRVCSVLGLLQCLALNNETRQLFLQAHIPLFLYPFLNTSTKQKPFENLRVASLGVIGALVKVMPIKKYFNLNQKGDDEGAIHFLMQTEIIPLCLRIMKRGQELSRTVATFIVQKILLDENGLSYICQTIERFFAVATVLQSMIEDLETGGKDDQRLLRHIIRCYLRLSENQRANDALKKCLPEILKNPSQKLITDDLVKRWHTNLLQNLKLLPPPNEGVKQDE